MSRLAAALLGKMPTTSVRRLISLFSRSSGLLDQICRQFATGKAVKARMSGPASARSAAARGHAGQAGAVSVDRVDLFEAAFAAEGEGDLGAVGRPDGGIVFGRVIGEVGEAGAIGVHGCLHWQFRDHRLRLVVGRTLHRATRQLADGLCASRDQGHGRSSRHPHSGRYLSTIMSEAVEKVWWYTRLNK